MLINEIDHYIDDEFFFIRLTFSNHQGESHQRIISYTLAAILVIEHVVLVQEPYKDTGSYSFAFAARLPSESIGEFESR